MNTLRGLLVETIVAAALQPDWEQCSHDYSAWDFRRVDGRLLEVKQSAERQSWTVAGAKPSRCAFDIRARQGRLEGAAWLPEAAPRRWADVYVFAHHGVFDAHADHRDRHQWTFYVVRSEDLPAQATIALSGVRSLSPACSFEQLRSAVARILR